MHPMLTHRSSWVAELGQLPVSEGTVIPVEVGQAGFGVELGIAVAVFGEDGEADIDRRPVAVRGVQCRLPLRAQSGETEHEQAEPDGLHTLRRGTSRDAAQLVRAIIANHDEQAHTAHDIAAEVQDRDHLPDRVRQLLDRRARAVHRRPAAYQNGCDASAELLAERQRWIDQHLARNREQSRDYGIELVPAWWELQSRRGGLSLDDFARPHLGGRREVNFAMSTK